MKCSWFKGDRKMQDEYSRKNFYNKLFVESIKGQKNDAKRVTAETVLTGKTVDSIEFSNDRDREMDCKKIEK